MSQTFHKLYNQLLVDEPQCWKTCGGGFCCSNGHPDFEFSFITQKGTEIIYLPREYAWAERELKTFHNQRKRAPKVFELDLGSVSIGLVYTRCELLGLCDGVVDKPMLCQFYPFLPVYSFDGELENVVAASVFDVTFDAIGETSPCTVKTKTKYHSYFAQDKIKHRFDTYTKFYLRCASTLVRLMTEGVRKNPALKNLHGKEFWNRWELQHLAGRLFDKEALIEQAKNDYELAKVHDPSFSLESEADIIREIRAL